MKRSLPLVALLLALSADAEWAAYPVAADTFSGTGSLTWSVDLHVDGGSSITYKILDKDTCIVNFVLLGTQVTGFGPALRIKLPYGVRHWASLMRKP